MTVTIGWWALPLLITCVAYGIALIRSTVVSSGDSSDAIRFIIMMTASTFVSLVVWLIYFIIF